MTTRLHSARKHDSALSFEFQKIIIFPEKKVVKLMVEDSKFRNNMIVSRILKLRIFFRETMNVTITFNFVDSLCQNIRDVCIRSLNFPKSSDFLERKVHSKFFWLDLAKVYLSFHFALDT